MEPRTPESNHRALGGEQLLPHPETRRLPAPPPLLLPLPTSPPRPHLSPDVVSLFERLSGKVVARGLGSTLTCYVTLVKSPDPTSGLSFLISKMGLGLPLQRVIERLG